MVSKNWLDLGWERPRIKLCWVLLPGNITGILLQKDKLKVMQPKRKGKFWPKNYPAKTLLSPKLPDIIYDLFQHAPKELNIFFFTKTVDSVFRALWLATQSVNILHYSLIHLQFLRASDTKLGKVASKMPSRFAAVTKREISQLIRQAVPEIHEEGDEVRFGSFNIWSFVFLT